MEYQNDVETIENVEMGLNDDKITDSSEPDQLLCKRSKNTRENDKLNEVDSLQNTEAQVFLTDYDNLINLGQIIVMHQIGGYLPPDTHLPIFDKLYSKITTNDSLKTLFSAIFYK
ncbi:hypothetical protein THOM_2740 [Trachipleistophora hominis]|uniref:Uncharacterized protein n=1 Tax=Trachipleistophora hominis TaxID=72359 RepID=L7JUA9_TRAHO|nr:hypothetical protein THOM_2740 [Trachipleistophora hominis]